MPEAGRMPVNRPKLSISQCKNTRERPVVNNFY